MAMNSPSGPIEATRNAGMMSAMMRAHDREKARDGLDERERDRLAQEKFEREKEAEKKKKKKRFWFF